MPIKLNGATSGSVELDVPAAVGSDLQLTLPATAGEVIVKEADGSVDLGNVDIDSAGRLLVGTTSDFTNGTGTKLQNIDPAGGQLAIGRDASSLNSNSLVGRIRWYSNVGGTSEETAQIAAQSDGNYALGDKPTRLVFSTTADGASSPTERFRILESGQPSFFTNTNFNLRSARTAGSEAIFQVKSAASGLDGGTTEFVVRADGDCENTNNRYGGFSDVKLKENIADAGSQWDDLKAIKVKKYNFKAETNHSTHTQIGVIAQEIELICPGLVKETKDVETVEIPILDSEGNPVLDDEGNPRVKYKEQETGEVTKTVGYSVLYMKAVKALQEAMTRIETLEAKVTALEATP